MMRSQEQQATTSEAQGTRGACRWDNAHKLVEVLDRCISSREISEESIAALKQACAPFLVQPSVRGPGAPRGCTAAYLPHPSSARPVHGPQPASHKRKRATRTNGTTAAPPHLDAINDAARAATADDNDDDDDDFVDEFVAPARQRLRQQLLDSDDEADAAAAAVPARALLGDSDDDAHAAATAAPGRTLLGDSDDDAAGAAAPARKRVAQRILDDEDEGAVDCHFRAAEHAQAMRGDMQEEEEEEEEVRQMCDDESIQRSAAGAPWPPSQHTCMQHLVSSWCLAECDFTQPQRACTLPCSNRTRSKRRWW
jgi:hypothetical protein